MNISNQDNWLEYSKSAWDSANRPPGLDPGLILSDPIQYDANYYEYFERRYIDIWLAIYLRVNPTNGSLLKRENRAFKKAWERNFCWKTIWKQILPFLVYGTSLGVRNETLVELASLYCIGQAIPSVVVDKILDNEASPSNSDAAFCMLSYTKALNGIKALKLPCGDVIRDTFVELTGEMYDKMHVEYSQRFNSAPPYISDATKEYLLPTSRLMSSVFLGILPAWAYTLSNKIQPDEMFESTAALRSVRQLNDEILDVYEDIFHGLITLPWLYAIEELPSLRSQIEQLWGDPSNADILAMCKVSLGKTSGQERAAKKAMEFLSKSMNITMKQFAPNKVFDITLLHNVRWALINWLELVAYNRKPSAVREPTVPQNCLFDNTFHPIEPVPGAGVLVTDSDNYVLMSLVIKRGMLRWELPAGVAKGGECLEETAKREAYEETGKEIKIQDVTAICWHYSRELNKGWMGVIFDGLLADSITTSDFMIITSKAFAYSKFDLHTTPDLYQTLKLENCDFDNLKSLCESRTLFPVAHESVVASGFVDWKKIPSGRIHPLHLELLKVHQRGKYIQELLTSNADNDFEHYDSNAKLYYTS